ncbi:MAG: hypothetical protein JNK12_13005 [Acidimicrobiales bacterium]|nr:hypothetical protein [Acidimicrobiales bacterium]
MTGDRIEGEDLELFERSLAHAAESATGPELDAALDDLGWLDALALDPQAAIATLFAVQGATNSTSSALDAVLASSIFTHEWVTSVARAPSVILPGLGTGADAVPGTFDGERVEVAGLATAAIQRSTLALVATGPGAVATVRVADLTVEPIAGMDPALGLSRVSGTVVPAAAPVDADWEAAVALGRMALSAEMIGACRTMLELARTHALERLQFGVPISSFQAVRHRLAEALVAIEAAAASCDGAWADATPFTAMVAKATAGRTTRTVARHCQQVLAGVGFTAEHDFHHHLKRALVRDQQLAGAPVLAHAIGAVLLVVGESQGLQPL